MADYDVCIVGSGAGGAPVAKTLAAAGYKVVVLEKGRWLKENQFFKDEIAVTLRSEYQPDPQKEPQVVETKSHGRKWRRELTGDSIWKFWNVSLVGGATNLMGGSFYRLKPDDFRLKSKFGAIAGANIEDWPISYDELEPYYTRVETEVGVSGRVVGHPNQDKRSTPDFPFPPTLEHPVSGWIDRTCQKNGLHPFVVPRAILTRNQGTRNQCTYSAGFCARYGCATGAKGSSRASFLAEAIATGNCEVIPNAMVYKVESDASGKVSSVLYFDQNNNKVKVTARIYVLACQAIETARLLLMSTGPKHPNGLANGNGLVGKNLIFSAASRGSCDLPYGSFNENQVAELKSRLPFINRALQDWYFYADSKKNKLQKGGTISFGLAAPGPIAAAQNLATTPDGLIWGRELKEKLEHYFKKSRHLHFEVFGDWLPNKNCFVSLDNQKDQWGLPVSKIRIYRHAQNQKVARFLVKRGVDVLQSLGGENINFHDYGNPSTNLVGGTARFGKNSKTSVLNRDCRSHEVENLYITDASFMPTGGSVPFTFTIFANALRVADKILKAM